MPSFTPAGVLIPGMRIKRRLPSAGTDEGQLAIIISDHHGWWPDEMLQSGSSRSRLPRSRPISFIFRPPSLMGTFHYTAPSCSSPSNNRTRRQRLAKSGPRHWGCYVFKTHAIFCTWDPLGEERQKEQRLLPSLSFTTVLQKVSLQKFLVPRQVCGVNSRAHLHFLLPLEYPYTLILEACMGMTILLQS